MAGWILESADGGHTLRLARGTARTIGRAAQADFIVDAPLVSRVHCRLTVEPSDQLVVEDLDSTNGTTVNGRSVDRAILRSGDTLAVGRLTFTVLPNG